MKKTDDQIDFNFSRPLDIQRNLDVDFLDIVLSNFNLEKKNPIFDKHLKLLIIELFYCWIESSNQMLAVSMSKRGYLSNSRYNPNKISSYLIKVINFLKVENFIKFYRGFFDFVRKKSRLSRIHAAEKLIELFKKVKLPQKIKINHPKREFLFKTDGKKKLNIQMTLKRKMLKKLLKTTMN